MTATAPNEATAYLVKGAAIGSGAATDLLIRNGVITETGTGLSAAGATVIDAEGFVAVPGMVDLHTHLREPGREDAETVETGTRAAALGGFTAVHAMANSSPVADTAGVVEQVYTLGRTAGWAAHILEQKRTGRLVRPSAKYVGPGTRAIESVQGAAEVLKRNG